MVEFKINITRKAIVADLKSATMDNFCLPAADHILFAVERILLRRFGLRFFLRQVHGSPGTVEIIGSAHPFRTPPVLRGLLRDLRGVCGTPAAVADEITNQIRRTKP